MRYGLIISVDGEKGDLDPNDPDRTEQIDDQFPDGMFKFEKITKPSVLFLDKMS